MKVECVKVNANKKDAEYSTSFLLKDMVYQKKLYRKTFSAATGTAGVGVYKLKPFTVKPIREI